MSQRTTSRDDKSLGVKLRIYAPADPMVSADAYSPGVIYSAKPSGTFQVHPLGKAPSPNGRPP